MPRPVKTCSGPADGDPYRIFVVGESWVAGSLYFQGIADAVQHATGRDAQICSLSFPHRNSKRIYAAISRENPKFIAAMFGGHAPDMNIVMVGVNDVLVHLGKENYGNYVSHIVWYLDNPKNTYVVTVPRILTKSLEVSILGRIKIPAASYGVLGQQGSRPAARSKLRGIHPESDARPPS